MRNETFGSLLIQIKWPVQQLHVFFRLHAFSFFVDLLKFYDCLKRDVERMNWGDVWLAITVLLFEIIVCV